MNIPKLPARPCLSAGYSAVGHDRYCQQINDWYEELKEWHSDLFKDAVEVAGYIDDDYDSLTFRRVWEPGGDQTHTALLINIQPIKEDTVEDILKNVISSWEKGDDIYGAIKKAREYLAAKEKK